MDIRYFETGGRSLLGTSHLAPRLRTNSAAVLLCNPFGEEAMRVHRSYRVLAGKLQEAGYPTMRFDYSGTGDSSGEAIESTVEHWLDDIEAAANEIQRRSGSPRIVLLGLRFGATLAALCAQRQHLPVAHLILWDPVVEGGGYLKELSLMHCTYMREELGQGRWKESAQHSAQQTPTEAMGMPISGALAAEMEAIDIACTPPRATHTTVITTQDPGKYSRLRAKWDGCPGLRWLDVMDGSSWNSDAALNSALVPNKEIAAIVSRIKECSP
jgi:alpha-beta hydrolase superfamily lysophospholipase